VETALKLGGTDLAAGKRHGFENPLVPECRFLILLLRYLSLAFDFFVSVPVLFSHKNDLNPHKGLRTGDPRLQLLLSPSVQQESA